MFDIDITKLAVIGIVALVVVGPERLPKVARTVGHLLGRLQRYVNEVKVDISREMQLDELKKLQAEMRHSALGFEMNILGEMKEVQQNLEQQVRSAQLSARESSVTAANITSIAPEPELVKPEIAGEASTELALANPRHKI